VSVRLLEWIGVAIGVKVAWQCDRDTPAGTRKAEVGPDAGSSLASGDFDAAGHATRGERKGPKV
jgi:hypothetical protein